MTADMCLHIETNERNEQGFFKAAATRTLAIIAQTTALLTLWSLTHRYRGLSGDGELYAVQALSKIVPALGKDLFLRNTSQDQYTFFSPLYALFISWAGVRTAAISLTVLCKIWFYGAGWALLRTFVNRRLSFLGVALLIVLNGAYGAYDVFKYGEDFLTARSGAEALVVTALALHFHGKRLLSVLVAVIALLIHPLMALPGLMVLLCISAPLKWGAPAVAGAAVGALGLAYYGSISGASTGMFATLDPPWLEVVRERSQFLFLQLWSPTDWATNSRPLLSLLITILVSGDLQIRRLGWACILVGVSGLFIAFIAGTIGPVAILLQGQAWRWLWIPAYVSVVLIVTTLISLRRDEQYGHICALLLILGWTVSPNNSLIYLIPAVLVCLIRGRLPAEAARYARLSAVLLAIFLMLWILKNSWDELASRYPDSSFLTGLLTRTRSVLGFQAAAGVLGWLMYKWIGGNRSTVAMVMCSATFAAAAAISLPGAFAQTSREGTIQEIEEFQDWRAAIPSQSNVYVVPTRNSAAFAWFTLERPNYLSLDQSSGVVFSRNTALEVKRRSQILLPVAPVDWKLLTAMEKRHLGVPIEEAAKLPMTRESLSEICRDHQLGFVVAQPDVGFGPIKHLHGGAVGRIGICMTARAFALRWRVHDRNRQTGDRLRRGIRVRTRGRRCRSVDSCTFRPLELLARGGVFIHVRHVHCV